MDQCGHQRTKEIPSRNLKWLFEKLRECAATQAGALLLLKQLEASLLATKYCSWAAHLGVEEYDPNLAGERFAEARVSEIGSWKGNERDWAPLFHYAVASGEKSTEWMQSKISFLAHESKPAMHHWDCSAGKFMLCIWINYKLYNVYII